MNHETHSAAGAATKEDGRWKMAKAAMDSASMIWNDVLGKFAQENKTFRDSSTKHTKGTNLSQGKMQKQRTAAGSKPKLKAENRF